MGFMGAFLWSVGQSLGGCGSASIYSQHETDEEVPRGIADRVIESDENSGCHWTPATQRPGDSD